MTADPWTLVARSQAGEVEAFGELYDLYLDDVYRFIYCAVEDHPTSEELIADTFFTALRSINGLRRDRGTPRGWLITIARDTVVDHLRCTRAPLAASDAVPDAEPIPFRCVERDHDAIMIRGLLSKLDGDQRRCLELCYMDGLDLTQIANVMSMPLKAVAVLHLRAIGQLRKLIEGSEP